VEARPKASMTAAASVTSAAGATDAEMTLAWEVVLVDRALLERAKQALRSPSTSEAIDRALLLVAELETHGGHPRPVRSLPLRSSHDAEAAGYPVQ